MYLDNKRDAKVIKALIDLIVLYHKIKSEDYKKELIEKIEVLLNRKRIEIRFHKSFNMFHRRRLSSYVWVEILENISEDQAWCKSYNFIYDFKLPLTKTQEKNRKIDDQKHIIKILQGEAEKTRREIIRQKRVLIDLI